MKLVIDGKTWDSKNNYIYGRTKTIYAARDDGIYEEWDELYRDGYGNDKSIGLNRLILPKEVFIAAYNAYIKGEK